MGSNESQLILSDRVAVVTGANKGIGLEICRQLALRGAAVVLTARDETRGASAAESLRRGGAVVFHQLDVRDPLSAATLARFLADKFGRVDILVNNAGASGVSVDVEGLKALHLDPESWRIPNERIRDELRDVDNLNEERIEKVLNRFLEDLKSGRLESGGCPVMLPAYSISKVVLNAYTRVLARRHPSMCINCVHPGYVKTDINWNTGVITTEEGARGPVMLAMMPNGGPSGCYYHQTNIASFDG